MGTRGVVASSQPLASSAGISILEQGGNAADAAVAVAAALNVTEPCSTGIGGDAFCLFWDAEKRQVRGLNASGRSPAAMSFYSLKKAGVTDGIGLESVHSVTVPGAAASWVDTVEKFGSGKLTLEDILAPAIRLADGGYPVHEITSKAWVASEAKIKAASPNGDEMMLPGSKRAPKQGEIMRMPNLARTFREVAIKGKAGYYKGRIAQAIVDVLKQKGGLMELEDLAKHAEVGSEEITPISYEYGASGPNAHDGVTLHECPPNGQGLVALVGLGVIDSLRRQGKIGDVAKMEHNSAEYLHTLIEALRFGFADAHQWVCDPAHGGLDRVESMLSDKYLDEQSKIFDPKKLVHIAHGNPESSSNTVYFSVTDGQGNACSFIMSNCVFLLFFYASVLVCSLPFTTQIPASARASSPRTAASRCRTAAATSRWTRRTPTVSRQASGPTTPSSPPWRRGGPRMESRSCSSPLVSWVSRCLLTIPSPGSKQSLM